MFLTNLKKLNLGYGQFKCLLLLSLFLLAVNCSQNKTERSSIPQKIQISKEAVNINSAGAGELQKLPGIGRKTAEKIIRHRLKYGNFRRCEHLILVDGISDRRFRKIRNKIKVN